MDPIGYTLQVEIPSINSSSAAFVTDELDSIQNLDNVLKQFDIPVGESINLVMTEQRDIDDSAEELSFSSSFPAYVGDVLTAHTDLWEQILSEEEDV
jgi:hypothetical protein